MRIRFVAMAAVAGIVVSTSLHAQDGMWTPYDGASGLACRYFNKAATLAWKSPQGDFDATPAISVQKLPVPGQWFTIDVTSLLDADGIALRGNRIWNAHARESDETGSRPRLVVTLSDGSQQVLAPVADAQIDCSTSVGVGTSTILKVGDAAKPAMLFFPRVADAVAARLELMPTKVFSGSGTPTFSAHAVRIPRPAPSAPAFGLAAKYPNDQGIAGDPDVLLHTGFEPGQYGFGKCPVTDPPAAGYVPADGLASENYMGTRNVADHCTPGGREPFPSELREVFIRLELRFGSDFRDTVNENGGKLPLGINGQYFDASGNAYCGNAGTTCVTGDRGWSARGGYSIIRDKSNPAYPRVQGHQYVYHYRQEIDYGTFVPWGPLALFELERWYTVEMQLVVNDPGVANGIMRWWVDGQLSGEVTDFQFRGPTTLNTIAQQGGQQLARAIWITFFHGGKNPPDNGTGMHAWTDNIVAARRYIGPRVTTTPPGSPPVTSPPIATPPVTTPPVTTPPVTTPPVTTPPVTTPPVTTPPVTTPPVTTPPVTTPPVTTPPVTTPPVTPPPTVLVPPSAPPATTPTLPRALPSNAGGLHFDGGVTYAWQSAPQPHFKVRAAVVHDCVPLNAKSQPTGTYRLSLWASDTTVTVPGGNATLLGAARLPSLTCGQPAQLVFATDPVVESLAMGRHLRLYLEREMPGSDWQFTDVVGWALPFQPSAGQVYADGAADKVRVWEFYHPGMDHYFVTQSRVEALALLDGTVSGWQPTGEEFGAVSSSPPSTTSTPPLPSSAVCRFFTAKFAPRSSHFYTPDAAECAFVEQRNPDWQIEGRQVFNVVPSAGDACPATTVPLYRLYNNGMSGAPNHRYTTSLDVRSAMRARGWIPEGAGAMGVIGCVPGYDD